MILLSSWQWIASSLLTMVGPHGALVWINGVFLTVYSDLQCNYGWYVGEEDFAPRPWSPMASTFAVLSILRVYAG